jgi:hypothetical protein
VRAPVMRNKRLVVTDVPRPDPGPGEVLVNDHIAEGRIPVAPLITGTVGVEGVAGAFEALASPEHHAKILVEPWRA